MDQEQFRIELNKEREYVKKNFYTRFNIYSLFISLFVTAGATIMTSNFEHKNEFLIGVLLLGTIISGLIARSLYATYKVLEVILTRRDKIDDVAKYILDKHPRLHSNRILGRIIPLFCTISLFAGFIASANLLPPITIEIKQYNYITTILFCIYLCWIYKPLDMPPK